MSHEFSCSFSSLMDFLEAYRTDIRDGFISVPADGEFQAGSACVVAVDVPVFEEQLQINGEIVDVVEEGIVVRLSEAEEGFEYLGWLYDLCGRFIEDMLATGRFKIAGRPPAEAAAAEGGAAVAAAAMTGGEDGVPIGATPIVSGEFDQQTCRDILMKAYQDKFNGVIRVDHPLGTTTVFFEKGGPVQVRDDPVVVDETLGVMLVQAGRITEQQFQKSLQEMNRTGKLQGECLIDMGLLNFPVLVMSLMRQTEMKVLRLYNNAEGSYAMFGLDRHKTKFVTPPLKVPAALYKMIKGRLGDLGFEELAARQTPFLDMYSKLSIDFPVDDLQMKKTELEFLQIVGRKSYRLREIFAVSNMGRNLTALTSLALMDMGILRFQDAEDKTQIVGNFRTRFSTKLSVMEDQNLFERLEIHWAARSDDVEKGYQRLVAKWKKMGSPHTLPEDIEEMRVQIFEELEKAYEVLRNTSARQEYRGGVYEKQQIAFSADVFYRQAELLMISERWPEVLENTERAVELMPEVRKYQGALDQVRRMVGR